MELALAPLCHRPSDLGRPYKLLRAFRPMLFQTPEHIVKNTTVGEIVPYSTVLQFLFSKAPKELMSPHEVRIVPILVAKSKNFLWKLYDIHYKTDISRDKQRFCQCFSPLPRTWTKSLFVSADVCFISIVKEKLMYVKPSCFESVYIMELTGTNILEDTKPFM